MKYGNITMTRIRMDGGTLKIEWKEAFGEERVTKYWYLPDAILDALRAYFEQEEAE